MGKPVLPVFASRKSNFLIMSTKGGMNKSKGGNKGLATNLNTADQRGTGAMTRQSQAGNSVGVTENECLYVDG